MAGDDDLTDDQLLTIPGADIPAGRLSEYFSRRSGIVHQREIDELILELSGDSGRRLMIFPDQDLRVKRYREEEDRRRARLAEEQMREYRERSDRLLARIGQQERAIEKRRNEIEDNALRLHDGRRVYVDGDRYRDQQGRVLAGTDRAEVDALHGEKPNASTWEQKQAIDRQAEEVKRQKDQILKDRKELDSHGQVLSTNELERRLTEADQRLTGCEKEVNEQIEAAHAELAAKADISATYAAVTLDDYAGPAGGEGKTAAPDFTRAVAGLTEAEPTQKTIQPTQPYAPGAKL